jgi:hypothetical protein
MAAAPASAGIGFGGLISVAATAAGIGISIYGGMQEAKVQQQEAAVSKEITGYEEQINEARKVQAQVQYQRQLTENFRQSQMAAARSRAAGVGQGAQFGSGAVAGREQAAGERAYNVKELAQNFTIGQSIFDITSSIDAAKIKMSDLESSAAKWQGIANIGSAIAGGGQALGKLSGGFGTQG